MLATLTLQFIDQALQFDQGAAFRGHLRELMPLAEDAYRTEDAPFRNHLGESTIGRMCVRSLWYSFRWFVKPHHNGQLLRLFNRGHLEEPRFIALLKTIGVKVWHMTPDGKQYRVIGYKGHSGGSLDAILLGVPDMPDIPMLGEFKTHNEKSFEKLKDGGVINAKWDHFVQMQRYMGRRELTHSLYMATNKNTDELYAEIVPFDPVQFNRYEGRIPIVIDSRTPPPKISTDPENNNCKYCDYLGVCQHGHRPATNCRTCHFYVPVENGQWICEAGQVAHPYYGCPKHLDIER